MMMKRKYLTMLMLITIMTVLSGCGDEENKEEVEEKNEGNVEVHVTSLDGSSGLNQLANKLSFTDDPDGDVIVRVSRAANPVPIEGFGAAMTGSSAILLNNNSAALNTLFSEDGIGLSYVRLIIGSSDFNKNGNYTYNDIDAAEDLELNEFSIAKDKIADNPVIPTLKEMLAINGGLQFMSSPWSAPAWMKTSKSLVGGSLLPQYYEVYADYFVKYLNAYSAEGITVNAITVQNEPLFEPPTYPGMKMSAEAQADFIGNHLGPKLQAAGLGVDIIAYDHNFYVDEDPDFPSTVLNNSTASQYIEGVAYHAYGGRASDVDNLLSQFPETSIYFTEQSGIQGDQTTFKGEVVWFMENVFSPMLRRGAKTIILWNLALDENAGPTNNGCEDCRGVITVTSAGNIVKNPEYYLLGHFSKFIKPGAIRLETDNFPGSVENIVFENPDSSRVMVVMNKSNADKSIAVTTESENFNYNIPANTLVTLKWNPAL